MFLNIRLSKTRRLIQMGRCVSLCAVTSLAILLGADFPVVGDPEPPLSRNSPRVYDVTIRVNPRSSMSRGWPYVEETNWSYLTPTSFRVTNQVNQNLDFSSKVLLKQAKQWHVSIDDATEYQIHFTETAYASRLNDDNANLIPWNTEWEEDIAFYLKPSLYVRSSDPVFSSIVETIINKETITPNIAAKKLIRYCLQNTNSNGEFANNEKMQTTGLQIRGAKHALTSGKQVSATDALCACIATLRAAGIPARPVVGITDVATNGSKLKYPTYVVWGEYALQGAGWVPFSAKRMRGTVNNLDLNAPWDGLGTWRNLNRHIPIAINFGLYDAKSAIQEIQIRFRSSPTS
ncbi:MAG: transglutaminase domain-containing protein [Phycisphaerales bacterium]